MKKFTSSFITFLLLLPVCCSYGQYKRQSIMESLDGMNLFALISESCTETNYGGFMTYTHCILRFNKDKVSVKIYGSGHEGYIKSEEPKVKEQTYIIKGDTLLLKDVGDYSFFIDTTYYHYNADVRVYLKTDYNDPRFNIKKFYNLSPKTKTH